MQISPWTPRASVLPAALLVLGTAAPAISSADGNWPEQQTQNLVELITLPHAGPQVVLFSLLLAGALGAIHAVGPGHGKTVVGAYLIGSRATSRHAMFLGLTVTLTHTLGVFALGLATMVASHFMVAARLLPLLSLLSGLIVFGMGVLLLVQRLRHARSGIVRFTAAASAANGTDELGHVLLRPGAVHHRHAREGTHGVLHSHGGSAHSHPLPGADGSQVSWRDLLALGVSGGLIPCPSAMVLLLAAVAVDKIAFGMLLVLAFSVGLALTLTATGLVFLHARHRIWRGRPAGRWPLFLPVLSASVIIVLGAVLCVHAWQALRL